MEWLQGLQGLGLGLLVVVVGKARWVVAWAGTFSPPCLIKLVLANLVFIYSYMEIYRQVNRYYK